MSYVTDEEESIDTITAHTKERVAGPIATGHPYVNVTDVHMHSTQSLLHLPVVSVRTNCKPGKQTFHTMATIIPDTDTEAAAVAIVRLVGACTDKFGGAKYVMATERHALLLALGMPASTFLRQPFAHRLDAAVVALQQLPPLPSHMFDGALAAAATEYPQLTMDAVDFVMHRRFDMKACESDIHGFIQTLVHTAPRSACRTRSDDVCEQTPPSKRARPGACAPAAAPAAEGVDGDDDASVTSSGESLFSLGECSDGYDSDDTNGEESEDDRPDDDGESAYEGDGYEASGADPPLLPRRPPVLVTIPDDDGDDDDSDSDDGDDGRAAGPAIAVLCKQVLRPLSVRFKARGTRGPMPSTVCPHIVLDDGGKRNMRLGSFFDITDRDRYDDDVSLGPSVEKCRRTDLAMLLGCAAVVEHCGQYPFSFSGSRFAPGRIWGFIYVDGGDLSDVTVVLECEAEVPAGHAPTFCSVSCDATSVRMYVRACPRRVFLVDDFDHGAPLRELCAQARAYRCNRLDRVVQSAARVARVRNRAVEIHDGGPINVLMPRNSPWNLSTKPAMHHDDFAIPRVVGELYGNVAVTSFYCYRSVREGMVGPNRGKWVLALVPKAAVSKRGDTLHTPAKPLRHLLRTALGTVGSADVALT